MTKIDNEGVEQLKNVRNALDVMYQKLEAKGVFSSVQEEFEYISKIIDSAQTQWDRIGFDNQAIPKVIINGINYKPE
tara:strand:- start:343 stop:573 length:231 start_codon:yes stop_codon:yes gene_type:complete